MITYKDIRMAIVRQLKKTDIEINSRDVTEGFDRPSFFVQLDNTIRSGGEDQIHKELTVQIYYFPSDRYEYAIEVLEMQETLESLFDLKLRVKDRLLNIDDLNCGLADGVLNCSFDLEFYDGRLKNTIIDDLRHGEEFRKNHPVEVMEDLEIKKE